MFKLIIILTTILTHTRQVPQAFTDIVTGKIKPITSFSGNSTSSSYINTLSVASGFGNPTHKGIALISYTAFTSVSFSFNSSITSVNATAVNISVQTYQSTYFSLLAFQYMLSNHSTLQIYEACYYCNKLLNLSTLTGVRQQNFSNITTTFSGTTYLTVTTMLSGIVMNNTVGQYLNVTLLSFIAPPNGTSGTRNITTSVSTDGNNTIEWTCVTLIVHKARVYANGEFYYKRSSNLSYSTNSLSLFPQVQVYNPAFLRANTMMFGISKLIMNVNHAITQQFVLNTDNVTDPQYNFKINQNQDAIRLEQFFIWKDTCSSSALGQQVPTTGFTCTNCTSAQYGNTLYYCTSCTQSVPYCATCNKTDCLTCISGTNRDINSSVQVCNCVTGYLEINQTCTLCSVYDINCIDCDQINCKNCQPDFIPSGTKCICDATSAKPYFVNGACSNLKGCLSPSTVTSGAYCLADQCDTINNFFQNAAMLCECMNNTLYNSSTGRCDGNCGDLSSFDNQCDLGPGNNHATGTPCDNNCHVVNGYYCYSPTTNSLSKCVSSTVFTGYYLYATKQISSNTANLYVQLQPKNDTLNKMDFSNTIKSSIPTSAISATYDYSTGILLIKATYTQSIQSTNQMLNISFDYTQMYSPSLILHIQTLGLNAQLKFNAFESYNTIILYISMTLGGLSLLFAVIAGIMGFKLIGWEIALPVQLSFFTFLLINQPVSALSSLWGLSFSTGFNQLQKFQPINNQGLAKGLITTQKTYEFLSNCNFSYVPLILTLIATLIFRGGVKQKQQVREVSQKRRTKNQDIDKDKPQVLVQPVQQGKMQKIYHFIVDKLLTNFCILLLINTLFSFGLEIQEQNQNVNIFATNQNVAAGCVLLILELGIVSFMALKIMEKDKNITYHCESMYYPIFYIVIQTLTIFVVVFTFSATPYAIFAALLPETITLIIYLKLKPYGTLKSFNSITGFYCQLLPPIVASLLIVNQFIDYPILPTISAFAILALILIGQGLSIVRLVLCYKQQQRRQLEKARLLKESKLYAQDQNLAALAYSSIKNQAINSGNQMLNWGDRGYHDIKPQYEKINSIDQYSDDEGHFQNEDELRKIKMRLRKEIKQKRNYDL